MVNVRGLITTQLNVWCNLAVCFWYTRYAYNHSSLANYYLPYYEPKHESYISIHYRPYTETTHRFSTHKQTTSPKNNRLKIPKPQTRLWSNLNPTRHFIYINLKLGTPLIWSSTQKFQTRSIHCGRVSQGSQNFQESTYNKSSLYNDTTYSQTMHHIYKRCTLLQFCR